MRELPQVRVSESRLLSECRRGGHLRASRETGAAAGAGTATYVFEGPWYQADVIGFQGDLRRQRRLLRPKGV